MGPATRLEQLDLIRSMAVTALMYRFASNPVDAANAYKAFTIYDDNKHRWSCPAVMVENFIKTYTAWDIEEGKPHQKEALVKILQLLSEHSPKLLPTYSTTEDAQPALGDYIRKKMMTEVSIPQTLDEVNRLVNEEYAKRLMRISRGYFRAPNPSMLLPVHAIAFVPSGGQGRQKYDGPICDCGIFGHPKVECWTFNPALAPGLWFPVGEQRYAIWRAALIQQGFNQPPTHQNFGYSGNCPGHQGNSKLELTNKVVGRI